MFITIDPYYNIGFYNECLQALKNNQINYSELIYIKAPYNFYFKLDREPILVNYDIIEDSKIKYLISKTISLRPNEAYLLQRREESKADISRYIDNDALKSKSETGIFFHLASKEQAIKISREFPDKIWYFGKYYNNKYKVFYTSNKMIKNYVLKEQILLEKTTDMKELGRFEADLNYRIFKNKDFLRKYTETPYFLNGQFIKPKIILNQEQIIV